MGKSPNSCFKLISCGADITDVDDELLPPESKQSSDKRRWSFRKRSARHQVPSNIVVSEPQFVGFDKENPEATADKFYPVKDSSVPEKTPVIDQANVTAPLPSDVVIPEKTPVIEQANVTSPLPTDVVNPEKIPVIEQANVTAPLPSNAVNQNTPFVEETNETAPLSFAIVNSESPPVTGQANGTAPFSSAVVNSEVESAPDTDNITPAVDAYLQEKVAVVIQAAARRFMAQRELQKLKNVVKLQAAVRGHLVRKQAIGTLRCVQAIAKMQILVRARRAHQCQLLEKDNGQDKNNEDFQIDLVRRNPDIKSNRTNTTVEKLLSNGFARQLLENTSKTKLINISCDPLRHDSAWQWLERWMAVTSSKAVQEQEFSCPHGFQGENENSKLACDELDVNPVVGAPMLSDSQLSSGKSAVAEGGEDSKTDSFGEFESQALSIVSDQCFSSAEGNKEHSQGEEAIGIVEENFAKTVERTEIFDAGSRSAHVNHPIYTDSVTDNFNHSTKRATFDPVETEGKKIDLGSRKNRNPAFAAVQAKFEELSSAPKANKSVSVCRDAAVESKPNHSQVVSLTKNKDLSSTENSTTQNPIIQVAGSECGTEISISSTLDSPDRSETDGGEIVLELGTSGEGNHNATSSASEAFNIENMNGEAKGVFTISDELKEQRPMEDNENMIISIAGVDSVKVNQQPVESITPIIWNQQENLKAEAYRSSPEGSPRSHITAPELHDTPSSQVSVQSNRSRSQNNVPARKPKSKSGSKNSPSNVRNDSDGRSSTGHLLKDAKNANRQSSLGMAKLDHAGNEPRRSSSNSLPSYMQATESARAKAHGSVSLKSSPDVHDKDNQMKRHSLPIGDEKQGSSPRVQRSTSQTQQSAKRNNNHSPQGSAERRWQR